MTSFPAGTRHYYYCPCRRWRRTQCQYNTLSVRLVCQWLKFDRSRLSCWDIQTVSDYILFSAFIYLFILFEIQQKYLKKNSEHKIVGLNINKHAARHCRALNLIKSRLLHATGWRHLNKNKLKIKRRSCCLWKILMVKAHRANKDGRKPVRHADRYTTLCVHTVAHVGQTVISWWRRRRSSERLHKCCRETPSFEMANSKKLLSLSLQNASSTQEIRTRFLATSTCNEYLV